MSKNGDRMKIGLKSRNESENQKSTSPGQQPMQSDSIKERISEAGSTNRKINTNNNTILTNNNKQNDNMHTQNATINYEESTQQNKTHQNNVKNTLTAEESPTHDTTQALHETNQIPSKTNIKNKHIQEKWDTKSDRTNLSNHTSEINGIKQNQETGHADIESKSSESIILAEEKRESSNLKFKKVNNIVETQIPTTETTSPLCSQVGIYHTIKNTHVDQEAIEDNNRNDHTAKGNSHKDKQQKDFRFFYQNINSLSPQNCDKWKSTLIQMKELKIDLLGLSETCTNWNNVKIKNKFVKTLKRQDRNHTISTSSIDTELLQNYIPGGTATILNGNWLSRFSDNIEDKSGMGRWSGVKIRVDQKSSLHIVTAYRVCQQTMKTTNSMSTYCQQYMHLKSKGIDNPNPRQIMLHDLHQWLLTLPRDDYIIIGIDANETISEKNSQISKFMQDSNLIDIYSEIHDEKEFSTHVNGTKRIDYIFTSENMRDYISTSGYLNYGDGMISDHRGTFCDISINLFNSTTNINTAKSRQIGTNCTNDEGEKYIRYLDSQFNAHRIYTKMDAMCIELEKHKSELPNDLKTEMLKMQQY
jgi:hypothetical protein